MEVNITTQVSIGSGRAEVFKYLTELKYHYLWNPHLLKLTPLTTLELGTKYQTTNMVLGVRVQSEVTVSNLILNRELELENGIGVLKYRINYRLNTKGKRTILSCNTIVMSNSNAFPFTKPVLKLLARREIQSDLQALKIAVEQHLE